MNVNSKSIQKGDDAKKAILTEMQVLTKECKSCKIRYKSLRKRKAGTLTNPLLRDCR